MLFIKFGLLIVLLLMLRIQFRKRRYGMKAPRFGPLITHLSHSQMPSLSLTELSSKTQQFQMTTCYRIKLSRWIGEKIENGTMVNSVMWKTLCPIIWSRLTQKLLKLMIDKSALTTALKIELNKRQLAADLFSKIGKTIMAIGWSQNFIAVCFSPI